MGVNGKSGVPLMTGETLSSSLAGYPITFQQTSSLSREFFVELGKDEKIVFKTWNKMVSVDIVNPTVQNFGRSVGLLGSFPHGEMLARNKLKVFNDLNEFGQEWQVLPDEPKLFHDIEGPQAPNRCEIPSNKEMRRRLTNSKVTKQDAENACATIVESDYYDLCIFDVMATGD